MPGRIKQHHSANNHPHTHQYLKPLPRLSHVRRQDPAAAPPTPEPSQASSPFENQASDANSFMLSKQTIIWLVVISVIVLAALIIVTCLLCKCKRRRKNNVRRHPDGQRWHPSLEIKDGRNDFQAWNRHAPPRPSLAEQGRIVPDAVRLDTWESGDSVAPLRANVKEQNRSAVVEPVVVDYATEGKKKNSRYYSNLSFGREGLWKRISQIGRAY